MKRKIIIDTDPGHDDVMAIMLAVKSNLFDIQAITTVCGNSSIANTTRNARFVLEVLNRTDIPVFSGARIPLKRPLIKAVVHGKSGLDGIDPTNKPMLTGNAVDKILSIVKANPNKITIVALGPLTNIALAILKDPSTMMKVKEIVIMGGAVKVPGNKNRVAEFNIFVDPEAADTIFSFPVRKTLVPLDACNHVKLSLNDFRVIKNPTLRAVLLKMVKPYINNIAKDEGVKAAMMYDPLTVYYLLNPKVARVYKCNIAIETKGELTRGMTVADLRTKTQENENVTVVEYISKNEFRNDFIEILSRE
jgi:purine nucleosidase